MNRRILAIILSLIITLTACSKKSEVNNNLSSNDKKDINIEVVGSQEIDKEQLQVLAEGINGVFNPLFAMSQGDKAASYLMFMPFIGMKKKMETDPQNSIISSMSRTGYILDFEIDEDLKWWDGEPVTAKDVYFSLRVLLNKDYKGDKRRGELFFITGARDYYNGLTSEISGITIVDDKHIKIAFDNFQDSFYYALDFRPIPEHYYQRSSIVDIEKLNEAPLGNSLYKLQDWEKDNYINLKRVDEFKYEAGIEYISIRDSSEDNVMSDMLRGTLDAVNLYKDNESLNQNEISKRFENQKNVENESVILRISNKNGMADINNRERIIYSILEYETNASLKKSISLISSANKAFVDMEYVAELKLEHRKSIPINLVYENTDLVKTIANEIKDKLSNDGYIVIPNEVTRYNLMKESKKMIDIGRNVLVLSSFKHGYMPDFSSDFSSYGDGKYLYEDVNLDEEIFNSLVDKNLDLKDVYKVLLNDIKTKKLAIGIGTPVLKTYVRRGIVGFENTEFMNWYEFAPWDIFYQ